MTRYNVKLNFEYILNRKSSFNLVPDFERYSNLSGACMVAASKEGRDKLQFKFNKKDIVLTVKEKKEKSQTVSIFVTEKHPFSFKVAFDHHRMLSRSSERCPQATLSSKKWRKSYRSRSSIKSSRQAFLSRSKSR